MELTPQLLETQQFPEKWRGYDQDAVDEFLERVGVGLAELQDRLRTTVARLKALEGTDGSSSTDSPDLTVGTERDHSDKPATDSDAGAADVMAVARALVLAQQAADAALEEAEAQGARITAEATASAKRVTSEASAEADRMLHEAEIRHEAATARLADVDSHIASLADEALRESRAEAQRLVSDAESRAASLIGAAESEAKRLTNSATDLAERHADEVASRRGAELRELNTELETRRREVSALQSEIDDRQTDLRSVVDGLQALVGRVGSLSGEPSTQRESADNSADEPTSDVVIDLTADKARVDHSGAGDPSDSGQQSESTTETSMRETKSLRTPAASPANWASLDSKSGRGAGRAGLSVVSAPDETSLSDDAPGETTPAKAMSPKAMSPKAMSPKAMSPKAVESSDNGTMVSTAVEQAPSNEPSRSISSAGSAVAEDPFLAALRGPNRVEFDRDGEPDADQSSFKRRRRRRL